MWSFKRFIYKISNIARVVPVPCSRGIAANGDDGVYSIDIQLGTDIGEVGLNYNAIGIPDRFQIYYDGNLVADSKYVGDSLAGDPPSYPGLLGEHTVSIFEYNGYTFADTGSTTLVDVEQSDIANGTTEPTDGQGTLTFTKATAEPTFMTVVVTGVVGTTSWNFTTACPG